MSKEIYISSTPHETRLAIVENDALTEIYYERENEYTLAGSIYNGKVTRVLPGMQSSFVDIGLERDAFLYITDFMEEAGDSADFEGSDGARTNATRTDQAPAPRGERSTSDRGGNSASSDRSSGDRNSSSDRNSRDRGNRNDRSDRGDRNEAQPRLPAPEPSDADLFTQAVSSLDPARPADGERSERGGSRRGGRNRRDRSLNSDGTPRRDRNDGDRADTPRPPESARDSRAESPTEFIPDAILPPTEQLGEASPGADGSRRWRGRRGRRGSRGREEAGSPAAVRETGAIAPSSHENDEPSVEMGGSGMGASDTAAPTPSQPSAPPERTREPNSDRSESRGNRNDFRGDRSRGDRGAQQPPRVPRGFAPSLSLYQVDAAEETLLATDRAPYGQTPYGQTPYGQEAESSAPIEPVILPGESLSKYRPGRDSTPESLTESAPTAAPEFKLPGAWDGGLVLPGETLRPRTPSSEPSRSSSGTESDDRTPRRDDRGGRDRGGRNDRNDRGGRDNRSGRDGRDNRGGRNEISDRSDRTPRAESFAQPAQQPAPEPTQQQAPAEPTHTQFFTSASRAVEPIHSTFVAPPPMPGAEAMATQDAILPPTESSTLSVEHADHVDHVEHTPTEPEAFTAQPEPAAYQELTAQPEAAVQPEAAAQPEPTPEQEFEPTEASASFRIDPVPPSEYRQSAPVEEVFPTPEHLSLAAPEAAVDLLPAEPSSQSSFIHGRPKSIAAQTISADTVSDQTQEPAAPELTSINDFGEMHSEPSAETHPIPDIGSAAPIEHESAVVDHTHTDVPPAPALYFAPGDGHLEEEEFVDDDDSLPILHGSAFEDQDSLREQETLEGAADLGTMLREMSIDQITRPEPSSLDEDDEEDEDEDFLEEDQLDDDAFASGSDYAEEDGPEEHDTAEEGDEHETEEADESDEGNRAPLLTSGLDGAPAFTGELSEAGSPEPRREGRRDGRRDGRRGDRGRRDGRGDRDRSSSSSSSGDRNGNDRSSSSLGSSSGDRTRDTRGGRGSRQSMQSTSLPAISDLLKPGQEILCQIAKEPIAKKGARITSHIALPGRFLVFMPTVHHTGVSRKIESDSERRRLKEILISERGDSTGGFIVRTAAAGASEEELRSDLRFLLNLWADIKTRSEASKSPALIYHDLNLIERVLRDQVTDNFSAIWVDTESEYERVLRFLQRFQPSLIRRVKLYTKETPLFEQFGITEEINKALRSKVWLKSGGSIVINQTEALVAIDINTGKFVGKTARLEDTIVKTNLDAIPEIVRQIRLRDLGGIIIIDFIDMDERKNRNKVMAALEEELKSDRAPSKVLQFNDFGLVAITRKRVKQSLERTLSTTCGVCQGTGMVKSPVSVCNDIYIEMRKMHKHLDRGDVMLRVHPDVVKQLKSSTKWLQEMEEMCGKTILVKSDPSLHPEQFDIH